MRSKYNRKRQQPPKHRTIPRWCRKFLLPLLLLFWLANLIFPAQTALVLDSIHTYVLEPAGTYLAEPCLLNPLREHVLEPLQEPVMEPLNRYVLKPLGKYVSAPLGRYVLAPLQRLYDTKIHQPVTAGLRGLIQDKLLDPFGITPPWQGFAPARIPAGSAPGSTDFQVHFLDVGQGLSVLVISGEHALLYDGGGRDTSSFLVSYLRSHQVTRLDYLIASHYDSDHLSGLIGALRTTKIDTILGPDYVHDSKTYTAFRQAVSDTGNTVEHPAVGSEYRLGDAYFTVLSPASITADSNRNSLAIRLVNGKNSFLLTGDADAASEEAMCQSGLTLYCDVLSPGHHGSSTSTSALFLANTQPEWAVISVGANDYGHPHKETLQRLADAGVRVLRTDTGGTIVAASDGTTITWSMEK